MSGCKRARNLARGYACRCETMWEHIDETEEEEEMMEKCGKMTVEGRILFADNEEERW